MASAQRLLETRIGVLLGPAKVGRPETSRVNDDSLTGNERSQFRKMADNPDVIDDVIEGSTDEEPASRRKVLAAIKGGATGSHPTGLAGSC